jgi:uncharacterized membrane protein YkvA (DUF1232 family)
VRGFEQLRDWAKRIRRDVVAVYIAARDPRTPRHVRLLALAVAAYALSPIDLIPDFIPVLGYLDDLLLVPLGIWLVVRAIPPDVLLEARAEASSRVERPTSRIAATVIVLLWLAGAAALVLWLYRPSGT